MEYKDIKTPNQLMKYLSKNFKYGFTYRNKVFTEDMPDFQAQMNQFYKLRTGNNFIKSGYGVCWDFCEFERTFFNQHNIPHECYFIFSFKNRKDGGPTHSFTLFEQKNKWFWFEYSWFPFRGIWEYSSKTDALKDIKTKFLQINNVKSLEMYKIKKAKAGLNTATYIDHCLNGEKVEI